MKIVPFNIAQWHVLILIHVVLSNLAGIKKVKGFDKITKQEYRAIYKYGIYSVIGGLCLFALSNNTRLFIEHYSSFQDVGIYSFYFRIASLVVILYRVMGILMYKKYFVSNHSKIDIFFAVMILGLFIINCFIYLVLSALPEYFPQVIGESYVKHIDLYILIIFQVSAWIGIALFESIINREFLTKQMILILVPCIGLFLLALYLFNNYNLISLKSIVALNTCFILLGNIGQILILKRSTFFYKKTLTVQIIIGILFMLYITT